MAMQGFESAAEVPCYSPLNVQEKENRILKLLPGKVAEEIACELQTVSLAGDIAVPQYTILSHCWGPSEEQDYIMLSREHRLAVSRKLAQILRSLLYKTESRVLWIDSICINQADEQERSSQIAQMLDIYGQASEAFVWLGEDDQGTDNRKHHIGPNNRQEPECNGHHPSWPRSFGGQWYFPTSSKRCWRLTWKFRREAGGHKSLDVDHQQTPEQASMSHPPIRVAMLKLGILVVTPVPLLVINDYATARGLGLKISVFLRRSSFSDLWSLRTAEQSYWICEPSPEMFALAAIIFALLLTWHRGLNEANPMQSWIMVVGIAGAMVLGSLLGMSVVASTLNLVPIAAYLAAVASDLVIAALSRQSTRFSTSSDSNLWGFDGMSMDGVLPSAVEKE